MYLNKTNYVIRVLTLHLLAALAQQQVYAWQPSMSAGGGVTGEVIGMPAQESHYVVELRPVGGASEMAVAERAAVEINGRFHFWRVVPGHYSFMLLGPGDRELAREYVTITADHPMPVQFRLKQPPPARPPSAAAGTVSFRRLTHPVPKAARKAYQKAGGKRRAGRPEEAERLYLEALRHDSDYVDARNDLGTLYYALSRPADALAQLERARVLEPADPLVLANCSAALIALGRAAEAEPSARQAYSAAPGSPAPGYLLGLARAAQRKVDGETLALLEQSAAAIPQAHLALAQVHLGAGDKPAARRALERFLGSGRTAERTQAEQWLKSLR